MPGRSPLCCALLLLTGQAQAVTIYKYTDASGVVTYTDRAMPGAQVFVFGERMVERLDNQVKLDTERHDGSDTLQVRNDLYAPVEVELRIDDADNLLGAPATPLRWIVPPRSRLRLLSLSPRQADRPMRYTPRFSYALGDPRQLPRAYRYALPWRGGPFRLTQGANGGYSHNTPKSRYALDIAMPEGTPIVAARAGVVVRLDNHQDGGGADPSGNFVRILHDDGTMGVYLHLLRGSVAVREGQRVEAGELLARSGNTGRSTGPHLHFVVQRNVGLAVESIPFQFAQPVELLPNFAVGGE